MVLPFVSAEDTPHAGTLTHAHMRTQAAHITPVSLQTLPLSRPPLQDIVERFHLLVVLSFVVAEDVSNSGSWLPAGTTVLECARIFGWEIVIDITKHAVLGKFNDIRPGIYREYTRDLCQDSLGGQSHSVHKLVGGGVGGWGVECPYKHVLAARGPGLLIKVWHSLCTLLCIHSFQHADNRVARSACRVCET